MAKKQKPEITKNIINQSAAAKIAGVTRQSLSYTYKKGTSKYNFFTQDGKIDISHIDWKHYVDEQELKGKPVNNPGKSEAEKKEIKKTTVKRGRPKGSKKVIDEFHFAESLYDAAEDTDGVILMTEWDEFRSPDFEKLKQSMKGHVIFDGRNIYDPKDIKKEGFHYVGMGR